VTETARPKSPVPTADYPPPSGTALPPRSRGFSTCFENRVLHILNSSLRHSYSKVVLTLWSLHSVWRLVAT